MVIFDTDFLVGLLRGDQEVIKRVKEIESKNLNVFTTSITAYELFKGAYLSSNPTRSLIEVNQLLENIDVLNFDLDAPIICAKIYVQIKKKGTLTNILDQMIASITVSRNETLITRNKKHYQHIPNLKIEIW